jgi:hypothetical protein
MWTSPPPLVHFDDDPRAQSLLPWVHIPTLASLGTSPLRRQSRHALSIVHPAC